MRQKCSEMPFLILLISMKIILSTRAIPACRSEKSFENDIRIGQNAIGSNLRRLTIRSSSRPRPTCPKPKGVLAQGLFPVCSPCQELRVWNSREYDQCLVKLLIRGADILPIKELDSNTKFPGDWCACYLTPVPLAPLWPCKFSNV